MNKVNSFCTLIALLVWHQAISQKGFCGADELRISTLKTLPDVAKAVTSRENRLEDFTRMFVASNNASKANAAADSATYIVPVVFHIVHEFGTEQIAVSQLLDGLRVLNNTFRKRSADTAEIVEAFKPIHADCDIAFRLATRDPQGNCHSGVNRIASPYSASGGHEVKSLIQWEPSKYLNVYVVKNAAGLAGHAVWPSDADTIPAWDGIVMSHDYMGSIGTSSATGSVVFAHECGHYLNLHHIWGGNNVPGFYYLPCADPNKDCTIDDFVEDTPPTIGWQTCNLDGVSCGTLNNVQNAMDYSYCNKMFTIGQKNRMQATLNSPIAYRNNLWQVDNLIETGVWDTAKVCGIEISASRRTGCTGTVITLSASFLPTVPDSVKWFLPGTQEQTSTELTPSVTYNSAGQFDITLIAWKNNESFSQTFPAHISIWKEAEAAFPFSESFEDISSWDESFWSLYAFDTLADWELTNETAFTGEQSVMLQHSAFPLMGKDEFVSPLFDLSSLNQNARLQFKYALAHSTNPSSDKIQVFYSQNCGSWALRSTISGANLQTSDPQQGVFIPSDISQWKESNTQISGSYLANNFRFKIVFTSASANRLYIDDINIDYSSGLQDALSNIAPFSVYPNPTSTELNISPQLNESSYYSYHISEITGKVLESGNNRGFKRLNIEALPRGLYFLKINPSASTTQTIKFIKE